MASSSSTTSVVTSTGAATVASSGAGAGSSGSAPAPTVTYSSLMAAIQEAVRKEVSEAVSRALPAAAVTSSSTSVPEAASGLSSGRPPSSRSPASALTAIPIIPTASGVSTSTFSGAAPIMSVSEAESRIDSTHSGVIVSPSLPPVPGKVIEKVRLNQFVDLRELMPDNIALTKLLSEVGASNIAQSGSRMREIEDPLTWCFYFMALIAVSVKEKRAKELTAYAQLIIYLAQRHGGRGWLAYDRLFRQQVASGSPLQWNEFAPSLMASTVLSAGPVKNTSCQLCNGADHTTFACALFRTSSTRTTPTDLPAKKSKIAEPCRRFNRGTCNQGQTSCKYLHVCSECGGSSHSALVCRSRPDQSENASKGILP